MFTIQSFWLPKAGSSAEEYEDASHVTIDLDEGMTTLRCAVADGATEASFSGAWARVLVEAFTAEGAFDLDMIPLLTPRWDRAVAGRSTTQPLAWYAEEKLSYGSFAALIGVRIQQNGTWTAYAAGDCCLFHVRANKLLKAFPIESADGFNNRPLLLSTQKESNAGVEIETKQGEWRKNDSFFLMSDALAQFMLAHLDAIPMLMKLKSDQFVSTIERLRTEKKCRNDDVTFVRVRATSAPLTSPSAPSDES